MEGKWWRKFFLKELDRVLTRWSASPKPSCMSCVICQEYIIWYLIQTAIHLWDGYSEGMFLKKIEIRLPNIKIATAWVLGSLCQVYVSPRWRWINNWGHRWGILSRDYFRASGVCSRRWDHLPTRQAFFQDKNKGRYSWHGLNKKDDFSCQRFSSTLHQN